MWIEVTPVKIMWWQHKKLDDPPRVWEADGIEPKRSDPRPPGRTPGPWQKMGGGTWPDHATTRSGASAIPASLSSTTAGVAGGATDSAPDRLLCTRYPVSQHSRESRKVVTKYRGRVKPKPPVVRHIDLHTPNLPRPFAPQAPGPATGGLAFPKISQTAIVQCPLRHLQAVVAVRSAIHTVAPAASPAVPQSRFRASNDMSA